MTPIGLRERKKERTRIDLIQAAVDLFLEQGYEETTVDDIVNRGNYSRSTFFRYFGSKEDVLFGDLPERFTAIFDMLAQPDREGDPFQRVREAFTAFIPDFTTLTPELEGSCIALWFSEPALYRRYTVMMIESEKRLTEFFAASWGVVPAENIECATLASAITGVGRAALQLQLSDRAAVHRALDRGFDVLAHGAAQSCPVRRRPDRS